MDTTHHQVTNEDRQILEGTLLRRSDRAKEAVAHTLAVMLGLPLVRRKNSSPEKTQKLMEKDK